MKDVSGHDKLKIDPSQSEDISSIIDGDNYVHYNPAVRLGSALATLDRYRDKSWPEVEPEARRQWAEKHQRPWSEFKEVIRQSWAEAIAQFSDEAEPDTFETMFRKHYEANYSNSHYRYNQYAPAYHLGYDLAVDTRLGDRVWAEIEPEAHRYWSNDSSAGPWAAFAEAVEFAWRTIRATRNGT